MLAPSGELLRAGMALKINHLKRAARSYMRDRTSQATGRMTSYAVAAGLFAAAGLFLIATFFVGLMALYRWVAISYGQFWGFGAVAAVLLVLAVSCAGVALAQLKRRDKPIVPLASRMRVAIATPRIPRGTVKQAVKEVATTIPLVPLAPGERGRGGNALSPRTNRPVQLGLMLAAVGLLGFTAARRRRHGHGLDA
ncbi:phage holin family protein [Bradyrhizobium liaoningense]|uniref:phage holin family protein n=1 Tax=Bradyrhizobium liaoningense TaxID=43992 RepID=UPI001BA7294D|nr:phage holin family protein [Bradyrhizobium liaoningense]MBR0818458.1 phage holin family protein [Bradyrhizobium liaoningense]